MNKGLFEHNLWFEPKLNALILMLHLETEGANML